MILRVGHYSQVEFVTVKNNNPFTHKGKQGTPLPYGTTRTLADGLYPFGWIKLTPCSHAQYRDGITRCQTANQSAQARRQEVRAQALAERERLLTEIQQREEWARQQAEAEQRRQEELAALPEEERDVVLLERDELNHNQVFALYERIDGFEPSLQKRIAVTLKPLWISQKRWKKKDCSKKQASKVAEIRNILETG